MTRFSRRFLYLGAGTVLIGAAAYVVWNRIHPPPLDVLAERYAHDFVDGRTQMQRMTCWSSMRPLKVSFQIERH